MEHEERLKAALADRYQIEREIGSGGMVTVYMAQDLKHDRKVVVKELTPKGNEQSLNYGKNHQEYRRKRCAITKSLSRIRK